jgi:xanthine dehydrogenase accessory factor
MSALSQHLAEALAAGEAAALVRITETAGSTPREAGAAMLVTASHAHGTIGGGQLEYHAIERARALLVSGEASLMLNLPLGPQMGQCCGGRALIAITRADAEDVATLAADEAARRAARPVVLIFGAGHTGRALARQMALLPFAATLIDDRPDELALAGGVIPSRLMTDPEAEIAAAPSGAAFLVMTHSHALDYRLTEAALKRGDAAYVGMIGSATKRARFLAQNRRAVGPEAALSRFVCPIGGDKVADKRPEVIAALAAAELLTLFFGKAQAVRQHDAA